jgi:hypothetical protein
MKQLINKQFEIEGIDYDFERMNQTGTVQIGKKSHMWYEVYQFSNVENYEKWRELCLKHMTSEQFIHFDFKYGMRYKYGRD